MRKNQQKNKNVNLNGEPKGIRWVFCKQYINRWGKLMVAADYGYQFWRFPARA